MAIDLLKVKQSLDKLKEQNQKKKGGDDSPFKKFIFKPSEGETTVRIVPYKNAPDNPFIELLFHYNLVPKRSVLSPQTNGNPDPVVEFAEKLMSNGTKEDWIAGKRMQPSLRTYVPILIRGREHEGVKYWGFGKTIYTELLTVINDPEYGDITDLKSGTDIVITFVSKEKAGNDFGTVSVRPKRSASPATTDPDIVEMIRNQPDIKEIFEEPTYDELVEMLERFLSGADESEEQASQPTSVASIADDIFGESTPKTHLGNELSETAVKTEEQLTSTLDDLFGPKE